MSLAKLGQALSWGEVEQLLNPCLYLIWRDFSWCVRKELFENTLKGL